MGYPKHDRNHPMSSLRDHIERTLREPDRSHAADADSVVTTGSITLPQPR